MSGLTHRTQAHIRKVAGTARLEDAIRAIQRRLGTGYYAHQISSAGAAQTERALWQGAVSPTGVDYSEYPPDSGEVFGNANERVVNLDSYGLTPIINEVVAARDAYPSLDERLDAGFAAASSFDALTDTPANKTASARKEVCVNSAASALEYGRRSASGSSWPATASNGDRFYHTGMAGGCDFVYQNAKWWPL